MQKDIHPTYYADAKATCSCGATFTVGSTMKDIKVEICSACHPFYTGESKVIDTAGRVEKFKQRRDAARQIIPKKRDIKAAKRVARKEKGAKVESKVAKKQINKKTERTVKTSKGS